MNSNSFLEKIRKIIYIGKIFDNPGGGTSEIIAVNENNVLTYRRGDSNIAINISEIHNIYNSFYGGKCSSNDLKKYAPHIFDSNARPAGHSCNCTFVFLLFEKMGITDKIEGKGIKGSPFYVNIKK
jgi:hypothetical protein